MISIIGLATVIDTTQTATSNHKPEQDGRGTSFRQTYHEIADRHVVETDVVEQLRANLAQLEDLHGRMSFLMKEVSYLLKKN